MGFFAFFMILACIAFWVIIGIVGLRAGIIGALLAILAAFCILVVITFLIVSIVGYRNRKHHRK